MLSEYHAGATTPACIRRDDGYVAPAPVYQDPYFSPPPPAEQQVLRRLSGRVLDVGCGVGRHALWLQGQGLQVVGIDISPGAAEVARARGCKDIRVMDVLALDLPDHSFDACILMGNNLGMMGTVEATQQMLRQLHRVVRPGGLLIAQGRDPLVTDKPEHLALHEANRQAGRPPGQVRIRHEYGGAVSEWFDWLLLERERAADLLNATDWDIVQWHGDPEAASYYLTAQCRPTPSPLRFSPLPAGAGN